MKAAPEQVEELLARHRIASTRSDGTDSVAAAHGGRLAKLWIVRRGEDAILTLGIGNANFERVAPEDEASARDIVRDIRELARLPHDVSFEHMFAELLLRASKLFEDAQAQRLEFSSLRLHPNSYHIGEVTLLLDKPLHLRPRLEPHSHDRRAVFDHRHGDAIDNPR